MPSPGGIYTSPYAGGWQDGQSGNTPLDATALNTMDAGIKASLQAPTSPNDGDLPIWDATANNGSGGWNATTNKKIAKAQLASLGIVDADVAAGAGIQLSKLNGFPNDATKFARGDGVWAAAADKSSINTQTFTASVVSDDSIWAGTIVRNGFGNTGVFLNSSGELQVIRPLAEAISMAVQGDSAYRLVIWSDASIHFGGGTSPVDTSIAWSSAGILSLTGSLKVSGYIAPSRSMPALTALTYGTSVAVDASKGEFFTLAVTNNTAFTIQNPTNPPAAGETQLLAIEVDNTTASSVTPTWGTQYIGGVSGLAVAAGKHWTFVFRWNGANWVFVGQSAAGY